MMAHTPGPYEVFREFNIRQATTGRLIASCGGYSTSHDQEATEARNRANAQLLAAAPELMGALQDFVNLLNDHADAVFEALRPYDKHIEFGRLLEDARRLVSGEEVGGWWKGDAG